MPTTELSTSARRAVRRGAHSTADRSSTSKCTRVSAISLAELAPFHLQAEEIGDYLREDRAREESEAASRALALPAWYLATD